MILSSNGPDDAIGARCYCGPPINKMLHGHCKPSAWRLLLLPSGCNFQPKFSLDPVPSSTSLEYVPSSSPPRSRRAVIESSPEPPYRRCRPWSRCTRNAIFPDQSRWRCRPCRRHPQARDAILEHTTTSCSPSPQDCAHHTVPEPTTPLTHIIFGTVAPTSSMSPQHPEPTMPSNSCRPWAHNAIVLL
jgi:hypothetical protein